MKWVVDPSRPLNRSRDGEQLQLFWLLCIAVCGKNADMQARCLQNLLQDCSAYPLDWLLAEDRQGKLESRLRASRIGQYTRLMGAIRGSQGIVLAHAGVEDLERIPGVGPKTARFFLLYTRNVRVAVLDRHVIRWLQQWFEGVPYPVPRKKYRQWEDIVLWTMEQLFPGRMVEDVDLEIWTQGRRSITVLPKALI